MNAQPAATQWVQFWKELHAITDLGIFFLMLLAGIEMHPSESARTSVKSLLLAVLTAMMKTGQLPGLIGLAGLGTQIVLFFAIPTFVGYYL